MSLLVYAPDLGEAKVIQHAEDEYIKPLAWVPDRDDRELHQKNCSAELVTRRLRELVPLLEFIDCSVVSIGAEKTVLSAPLLESAMNQNGTHQASVFYLLADYCLGVGMFGVLPGVYVTGVHNRCRALPVQYWLKRGSVKHLAPGTGCLRAETHIPAETAAHLRRQLIERGRGELAGVVQIYQGEQLVATAEHVMGIYANTPRASGIRANLFQVENLKSSASMISGLRDDAISRAVAQGQGTAIAARMSAATPQLPSLVRARTIHLERYLRDAGLSHQQVLVLGVGFDPKPVTFASSRQHWFGVDLPDMLRERERRFSAAGVARTSGFTTVAADLRLQNWDTLLVNNGFNTDASTLVILEGISMYLSGGELSRILRTVRTLCSNQRSRLWIDHVTPRLFEIDDLVVRTFLSNMARLGEPFVLGMEDPQALCEDDWILVDSTSAAEVLGVTDLVPSQYRFSLLRPAH